MILGVGPRRRRDTGPSGMSARSNWRRSGLDRPRETDHRKETPEGLAVIASGYPRSVPGVPPAKNLHGISFAVANATGFVARAS